MSGISRTLFTLVGILFSNLGTVKTYVSELLSLENATAYVEMRGSQEQLKTREMDEMLTSESGA